MSSSAGPTTETIIHQALLGDAIDSAATLAAFVLDENGRYLAVNDAACALSGYERSEIVGATIGTFNPHLAQEHTRALARAGAGGRTWITTKDGSRVDVEYRTSETRVGRMPFLLVICWQPQPDEQ